IEPRALDRPTGARALQGRTAGLRRITGDLIAARIRRILGPSAWQRAGYTMVESLQRPWRDRRNLTSFQRFDRKPYAPSAIIRHRKPGGKKVPEGCPCLPVVPNTHDCAARHRSWTKWSKSYNNPEYAAASLIANIVLRSSGMQEVSGIPGYRRSGPNCIETD